MFTHISSHNDSVPADSCEHVRTYAAVHQASAAVQATNHTWALFCSGFLFLLCCRSLSVNVSVSWIAGICILRQICVGDCNRLIWNRHTGVFHILLPNPHLFISKVATFFLREISALTRQNNGFQIPFLIVYNADDYTSFGMGLFVQPMED